MTAPTIRTVYFDIGNVLLHFNAADILKEVALQVGRHPIKVAKYLWASKIGDEIELGRVSGRELYGLFRTELDYNGNYAAFRKLWCDHFSVLHDTVGIMRRISRTHKIFLLSNTNALHYDFICAKYAFPKLAHGAVLSYKLGLRKPDPQIYEAALGMAKAKAEESVFIDDLPENVDAARRLGIHGILFRGAERLKAELRSLGVLNGR
jgi:FMN phosphatase YigB (HAD superfamily)